MFSCLFSISQILFAARKTFCEMSLSGRGTTLIVSFNSLQTSLMEHNQVDYIFHHRHFFLLQGCWSENKHLNTKSLYMFYGFDWEWRLGG